MGDTIRRGRGMKVGNGVVKREIVRFLFSREDGSATESEIRAHLFERFGVQDRATIRNQHLGYLKTTGRLEVAHEPGKENVWSVVDSPSIADYLFAEFAGDDLAEVYRSPFVRERVVDWFCTRREEMEISPETMACARDGRDSAVSAQGKEVRLVSKTQRKCHRWFTKPPDEYDILMPTQQDRQRRNISHESELSQNCCGAACAYAFFWHVCLRG